MENATKDITSRILAHLKAAFPSALTAASLGLLTKGNANTVRGALVRLRKRGEVETTGRGYYKATRP